MKLKKLITDKIKKLIKKFIKLIEPKILIPKDEFSKENYGIISRLENIYTIEPIANNNNFKKRIINLFGIQINFPSCSIISENFISIISSLRGTSRTRNESP